MSASRRTTHTGLPRHSNVRSSPTAIPEMSASTGAPAAFARSDGSMLPTNGESAATPATPPAAQLAISRLRRELVDLLRNGLAVAHGTLG